jgi:hypothetical protein
MTFTLTEDNAALIRNLLHKERIEYQYCDYTGNDAVYFKNITETIARMEHPEQFQSTEGE